MDNDNYWWNFMTMWFIGVSIYIMHKLANILEELKRRK